MFRFFPLSALLLTGSLSLLADVDLPLLNLAPAGTRVVFGANVTEARMSPFGQFVLTHFNEATNDDNNFQSFVLETGFDPRQDVQSLLAVSSGSKTASQNAIIMRAMFDQSKLEAAAQTRGNTVQSFQGVDMILMKNGEKHNGENGAVAFLSSDILVAGDKATVMQIVSNRASPTSLDPTLFSQIQKVGASNAIWFVSIVPGADLLAKMAPPQAQQGQVLQSILASSGGIELGDQISLSFDAIARSPQDATSLGDVIHFGAGLAQMQSDKDPDTAILSNTLNNLVVAINGSSVHIGVIVPEKDLEHLAQSRPDHRQ